MITTKALRAPNPSPLTLDGTNTYLLLDTTSQNVLCIDPGPVIPSHIDAILAWCITQRCRITAIALTHGHPDHAPAAQELAKHCNAPIYAHALSALPHDFSLHDSKRIAFGDGYVTAMDAPGHTFDHLVFYEPNQRALYTGDVILGHGYVVIAPPGGAMRPYQRTLARLESDYGNAHVIYPGHGEPIQDPAARIADYRAHREHREHEIHLALQAGEQTIAGLVAHIYAQTPHALWPAAARQILAYLLALEDEGRVDSRILDRNPTELEAEILFPKWARIVGERDAELVEAELGTHAHDTAIRSYSLLR